MRHVLLSCLCFLLLQPTAYTQHLWGCYSIGGTYGAGTFFRMDLGGGNLTRYFNCGVGDSGSPQTTFLPQPGNFYYGMTVSGGQYVRGDIYRFDVSSLQYTSLFSMDTASGYYPRGPLYKAGDGNLYGLTSNGGANGLGVLFRFDPSTNVYTKLHEFDGPTGQYPDGGVVQAANGKIYGMTTTGGSAGGGGVIFSWDPTTSTYLVEYSFSFSDGFTPFGTLTEYNGYLWGLTFGGGATGNGTLFRFDPSTSTHLLKYSFDGTNGSAPQGNLTLGANGVLYSAASQGGTDSYGVLFSFDTNNDQYTLLHDFDPLEGSRPRGQLCYASDGKVYGTCFNGGANSFGSIYSYDPVTNTYATIDDGDFTDGGTPYAGLIEYAFTIGIEETDPNVVRFFPNPASRKINYAVETGALPNQIRVYDPLGRLCSTLLPVTNTGMLELEPGCYTLLIDWTDRRSSQRLVVTGE